MKLNSDLAIFERVNFIDKLEFTRHLSVMLKSGIPLSEAISDIRDQSKNPAFRKVLKALGDDVTNGQSLYKALSKYPKIFDPLYLNLIKIGEESGSLENNLLYLSDQLKKADEFKKKVRGALLYPAIVLMTAIFVGGGIAIFVLPKLVDLFQSLDVELPLSTRILLGVSTIMRDYGIFILIGLGILAVLFRMFINLKSIKPKWHAFLLTLPVLGPFLQYVEIASFSRNFGIMLKSGLPINTALDTEYQAETNLVYKKYLEKLNKGIADGKSIAECLEAGKFKYWPTLASRMIGIGEKTGKLDESLLYLGDYYEGEIDDMAKNFSNILEPMILLGVGIIVAFVALSIISPIYSLTGSIQK